MKIASVIAVWLLFSLVHADTLFFTEQQRLQLDRGRDKIQIIKKAQTNNISEIIDSLSEEEDLGTVRLDGIVNRKEGYSAVWSNGQLLSSGDAKVVKQQSGSEALLQLPGGSVVTLKPGQIYKINKKETVEEYELSEKELGDSNISIRNTKNGKVVKNTNE